MKIVISFILIFCIGCHSSKKGDITLDCQRPELESYKWIIGKYVSQRFPKAYVLMAHGYSVPGDWQFLQEDKSYRHVQDFVDQKRKEIDPDRTIVLWICNAGSNKVYGKNVYYFDYFAWSMPDEYYLKEFCPKKVTWLEVELQPGGYGYSGSIFELIKAPDVDK